MSETLYQIEEEWQQIASLVEDSEVDEQVFKDTLDAMDWNTRFKEKMDCYVMILRNTEVSIGSDEGQIKAIENILETLKSSKKAKENKMKYMKENMLRAMVSTGNTKFESEKFKYWTQKVTPALVIDKEEDIPLAYYTTPEPVVDKKAIREALKDGKKLGFAHLEEQQTVRFK